MKDGKKYNKELFMVEAVVGVAASMMLIAMVAVAAMLVETHFEISVFLIVTSIAFFVIICMELTKMEQIVGYYVCGKCHHKYVPTYNEVLWSMHLGRTRYMKCPKCHKKTWQKKVM